MADVVLVVRGLSVAFGEKSVTQDVTFDLFAGQTTALVGESGSGKSITSAAIAGLLPPGGRVSGGEVRSADEVVWASPDTAAAPLGRGLSLVFQDPMSSLNPSMRIGCQVGESLRVLRGFDRTEARRIVESLLAEVELPEPALAYEKYPHELSGGQKQRVMIALALASEPTVLIADEPTTALDVTVQRAILALLRRLQERRGLALLFITHDLDVVREIGHDVHVMQQGRIVESGSVAEVLGAPAHAYTRSLLAARPKRREEADAQADARSEGEVLVSASGLSKRYGDFFAVRNVAIAIRPRERVGLVGESGSGKSTLGRLLLGLIEPSAGDITLGGQPLESWTPKRRAQLGQLVFQDPYSSLNPKKRIGDALDEALGQATKNAKARTSGDLLEEVGLERSDAQRFPDSFSGGQRQRIVIARALALSPRFLVLDESVAALDLRIQAEVLTLLQELGERHGLAFLFISHDLTVIEAFCERVLVMRAGEIVERGPVREVMASPQTEYTAELLACRPGAA
jgi:ABC-type glutathione transport system ATPase component